MCGGNNQSIISALGERFRFFFFENVIYVSAWGFIRKRKPWRNVLRMCMCTVPEMLNSIWHWTVRWTDFQSCSLPAQLNYNNDCWTVCNSTSSQTNGVLPTIITLFHRKWSAILIKAVTPKTLIIVWWPNVRAHQGARVNITFQRWMQHLNVSTALVRRMKLKVVGLTLFICT